MALDDEMLSVISGPPGTPIERLQQLLEAGANVGHRQIHGPSALYQLLVSAYPRPDMIELMVSHGAKAQSIAEERQMFQGPLLADKDTQFKDTENEMWTLII